MLRLLLIACMMLTLPACTEDTPAPAAGYVTDTGQTSCYDAAGYAVACAAAPAGQDAHYQGRAFAFTDHGDGTVTDDNTGLRWERSPDFTRVGFAAAAERCAALELGGTTDWRLPTIKELFSIADFRGGLVGGDASISTPYLDEQYFEFVYPDAADEAYAGQYWSSTAYVQGPIVSTGQGVFGFNFSDGHIKAYPAGHAFGDPAAPEAAAAMYARCVSGAEGYGINAFVEHGDGTVSDDATGLMWQRADDGATRDWVEALAYCEALQLAGYDDWRLPNVKELQSVVDYDKPDWPAIDDVFVTTDAESWFWTSTTHGDNKAYAAYIAFGRAWGKSAQQSELADWHGAGAQRSDPKVGDPADYELCSVNACDEVRIDNYVRCVRGAAEPRAAADPVVFCAGAGDAACCGDATCDGAEDTTTCPQDCVPGGSNDGPVACATQADCEAPGACPPDAALGCACQETLDGTSACIPTCDTADDCPAPPGTALTCNDAGLCVPQGM